MRDLTVVSAEPQRLLAALRSALAGDGPAVHPVEIGADAPGDLPARVPQRVAAVVGTSGSTGSAKRVVLPTSALLAAAAAAEGALGGPGQWVLALPVHWIAGINVLVRSITMGADPIVDAGHGMHPGAFAAATAGLDPHGRRFTSLVPAQLARLLDDHGSLAALQRYDRILVGGQATDPALLAAADAAGVSVTTTYGGTETCGGVVWDGAAIGDTAVELVDGRIHLRGSSLADGYLEDADRDAAAFVELDDGQRWFRTDDAGRLAPDGRLEVIGRLDDVIISGGIKLDLREVLALIRSLDGAGEVEVAAVDHAEWGQAPAVVVTGALDETAARTALVAAVGHVAGGLRLHRVDAIPRTATGKPDRAAIARLFD